MAARATWKGFLKISLVTIPIKVFPATADSESISFNQLHEACATRIQQKRWCPHCKTDVANDDIVKGYEFEKGRYVVITGDELDAVQPPSTRVIDVDQFIAAGELDPMYVNRTYYVVADGALATDATAVLQDAMAGTVAIGKLAIYGREYLVALRRQPQGVGFILHTLHHAGELRPAEGFDDDAARPPVVLPSQVALARRIVTALTGPLDLSRYHDDYRDGIQQLIAAKIAGDDIVASPLATPAVLELRDALERSLAAVSAKKKTPAKATAASLKKAG